MTEIIHSTNMAKVKLSNNDFKVNRLKTVKNPSLSFFGPTGDYARSAYWQSHAYDLYEYSRIIDTEAFATRAFNKKTTLMFKAGYSLSSENEKNAKYIKQRLQEISYVTGKPFDIFLKETASNLITFHNAYIVRVRKTEASGGLPVNIRGKMVDPVAGYFNLPPETVQLKIDKYGKVMKYRQYISATQYVEYSPENVIHLYFNKRTGFLMGTPPLESVKDDILALRRIEESVETLIYKSLFPIIHVKVGTDKVPAKTFPDGRSEVDMATVQLKNIEDDGGVVTDQRVEIKAIGAESLALRVESYLAHFKERVFVGLGMSSVDFGVGDGSGRATGEVLSESLKESVIAYQDAFMTFINEHIIKELLVESGRYKNAYSIPDTDEVLFTFNEIDIVRTIKIESHELNKMTQGLQGITETRKKLGMKALSEIELKKMRAELQYDINLEEDRALSEKQVAQAAQVAKANKAATNTSSPSSSKAKGSSNLTKSVTKPKNQHSDAVNSVAKVLYSDSAMKTARIYNIIKNEIYDESIDNVYVDKLIIDAAKAIINSHTSIDKDGICNIISDHILNIIINI